MSKIISKKLILLSFCFVSLGFQQACVGVIGGAAATAGVAAAQEGGLSRAASDLEIQALINDLWLKHDLTIFRKLDLTVNQGRVLVTGVVQNPEHRVEAVRLAWQPEGVVEVINEVVVSDSQGILGFARDSWISGRLRTAITFDRDVQSINYNIDTVQGTVYLMGVAQSQHELNRVIEIARTINDVKNVVSYVKFAGDDNALNTQDGYRPPPETADYSAGGGFGDDSAPTPLTYPETYQAPEPLSDPVYNAPPAQRDGIESEELLWDDRR